VALEKPTEGQSLRSVPHGAEGAWKRQDPPKRVLSALISDCALPALLPGLFSRHRVFEEILMFRREALRKLENLKAVGIADGPELDIG
jgi:hypothetical protein